LGENLLPSDVNPCTALLTVLRYGVSKNVTVYFKDGTEPEQLDFKSFKQQYTIDPSEAKRLEQENKLAFPNIDYAVVEYPLPLLEKGIEIVDSPGLNDTEARNELSLSYINNCNAIFFVFRAVQPCTLEERRYLENYIKGRGLSVFFIINAWDEIRKGLINPDDPEELAEAEGNCVKFSELTWLNIVR
jgi:replication fork clamp-binding protein CrfC